ncbi:MAG: trypsin-like peptidase domain-containing protein [Synergistaceae bacterium]|nr:trypsin-like peptidase domain-containing protein [Synergistaceae bacterium]
MSLKKGALILLCAFAAWWALTALPSPMEAAGGDAAPPRAQFEERRRAVGAMMEAATVWIVAEDDDGIASGTGFIVGDGYIATNAHVVDGLGKGGTVYVLNERIPARRARIVKVIHEDKDEAVSGRDFALLRFDPPKGVELPVLSLNFDVKRMDRVSAWGYPAMATRFDASTQRLQRGDSSRLESPPVIYTEGTVNAIVKDKLGSSILHSASIAGGNSGGPLVNGKGEVVGMNTWGYKEEDEGAFLNGAQLAAEIAFFLADNGVTPRLAPGQQMAARPERSGARGGEAREDRRRRLRRRFGNLSVVIPRGWSVIDEDEELFLVGADDGASAVGIVIGDMEGQTLRQLAGALSKELGGTTPERDDDGVYIFSFSDDGTDTLVCVAEGDDKSLYTAIFISGDGEHPGVEEFLSSLE